MLLALGQIKVRLRNDTLGHQQGSVQNQASFLK